MSARFPMVNSRNDFDARGDLYPHESTARYEQSTRCDHDFHAEKL
jgi:hypothetical protein